jgi:hypothetical protein
MIAPDCPGGICQVKPQGRLSSPEVVKARREWYLKTHPLFNKKQAEATPCNPLETAEDYRELIHRCDLQIWEILELKELAENKLAALEA